MYCKNVLAWSVEIVKVKPACRLQVVGRTRCQRSSSAVSGPRFTVTPFRFKKKEREKKRKKPTPSAKPSVVNPDQTTARLGGTGHSDVTVTLGVDTATRTAASPVPPITPASSPNTALFNSSSVSQRNHRTITLSTPPHPRPPSTS